MACFLITGLSGFTGRHLEVELRARGHAVVGITVDLTEPTAVAEAVACENPDYVIHLAAISHVAHGSTDDFSKVNVVGTENLLKALAALPAPPRKVLLASSANIYGNAAGDAPIPESARVSPENHYGVSKAAMEVVAATYADRLPIVVVRPFNFTGVGQSQSFLVPKLVAAFATRAPSVMLGNLDVARDFSDVRDIVRYIRILAETAPAGSTVNLCSGKTLSFRRVFDLLVELTGHRPAIVCDSALMRGNEIKVLSGDRTRLARLLGDEASSVHDFRDTLSWMLGHG